MEPWEYGHPEKYGLVGAAQIDGGGGYDWALIAVFWHADSKSYRVYEGSGCSCDGPYDDVHSLADFGNPLTFAEARKELQDYDRYDLTVAEKIDAISDLAQFEAKRLGKNPTFFA